MTGVEEAPGCFNACGAVGSRVRHECMRQLQLGAGSDNVVGGRVGSASACLRCRPVLEPQPVYIAGMGAGACARRCYSTAHAQCAAGMHGTRALHGLLQGPTLPAAWLPVRAAAATLWLLHARDDRLDPAKRRPDIAAPFRTLPSRTHALHGLKAAVAAAAHLLPCSCHCSVSSGWAMVSGVSASTPCTARSADPAARGRDALDAE